MEKETIIIRFYSERDGKEFDLDIPLFISANELIIALNEAYNLGIDVSNIKKCYLQAENPVALLRGNKTLQQFGLRNGSRIYYTNVLGRK
ncbi:EsaB/YukD family protein [Eubacterium ramulus]